MTMAASERLHLGTATNLLKHLMLPIASVCEAHVAEQGQRGRQWWADQWPLVPGSFPWGEWIGVPLSQYGCSLESRGSEAGLYAGQMKTVS